MAKSSYILERSNRRSIAIIIRPPNTVLVKAPYLVPPFIIDTFVSKKRSWIEKQLRVAYQYPETLPTTLAEGDRVYVLGTSYAVHIINGGHISLTKTMNIPNHLLFRWKQELTNWYIGEARRVITKRVEYFAAAMHTSYTRLSFSDTSSKWGSCSPDNALQFNWRLIMAPLIVLDYVVVHELAHTKEKNHGAGFWRLVAAQKPAYKQHIRWLKLNTHTLHGV